MKTIINPKNRGRKHSIILPSEDIRKKYKKQKRNLQKGALLRFFSPGPQKLSTMLKLSLLTTKSSFFSAEPFLMFVRNIN
jgi:hypothetical protein